MARKPSFTTTVTVTKGTGVMSKDGKTPFAAGTMFQTHKGDGGMDWKCPMSYSIDNVLAALAQPETSEVQIITPENVEYIIRKKLK